MDDELVEFDMAIEEGPQNISLMNGLTNGSPCTSIRDAPQKDVDKGAFLSVGKVFSGPVESPKHEQPDGLPPWPKLPKDYRHAHVPKKTNLADGYGAGDEPSKPPTTLMIRNIPNRYTQRELITELEGLGFAGMFDFLYVPLDKGTMSSVGYAFVNFVDHHQAASCMEKLQNYHFKKQRRPSGKIAAVSVAHIQGLEANLAHYEKAAVNTAKAKQRRPVVMANISQAVSSSPPSPAENTLDGVRLQ